MCPKLGGVVASVSVLVFAAVLIGAVPASARHSSPSVRSSGSVARVRSRRSRCAPRGAITLKKTRRVLAYENDGYDFDTGYVCSEVNGRRTRIYQVSSQIGSGGDVEAIKGDFVQYSWTSASGCRGDACPPSAAETFGGGIVNARTGKPLTVPSGAAAAAFTAAGSIAWVTGSPQPNSCRSGRRKARGRSTRAISPTRRSRSRATRSTGRTTGSRSRRRFGKAPLPNAELPESSATSAVARSCMRALCPNRS